MLAIEDHDVVVDMPDRVTKFRSTVVKPYYRDDVLEIPGLPANERIEGNDDRGELPRSARSPYRAYNDYSSTFLSLRLRTLNRAWVDDPERYLDIPDTYLVCRHFHPNIGRRGQIQWEGLMKDQYFEEEA